MNKKHCPECRLDMNKVKTVTHYGIPLALDQCEKCGGLWFDGTELFQAHRASSEKMTDVNIEKLQEDTQFPEETLVCPNDNVKLDHFKDPNFPDHLQVEHCNTCGGYWMNRGEFVEFNTVRQKKKKVNEPKERTHFEKQIDSMLNAHSNSVYYGTMGNLAKFLSTPMDRSTMKPIQDGFASSTYADNSPFDDAHVIKNAADPRLQVLLRKGELERETKEDAQKVANAIQFTWQIVRILMRLFLRM